MTREQFATHQAAHAAVEMALTGNVTQTLDIDSPCPYCGWRRDRTEAANRAEVNDRAIVIFAGMEATA